MKIDFEFHTKIVSEPQIHVYPYSIQPRKRNIEGEEVKEKKKKMSNEEDNWIRNR